MSSRLFGGLRKVCVGHDPKNVCKYCCGGTREPSYIAPCVRQTKVRDYACYSCWLRRPVQLGLHWLVHARWWSLFSFYIGFCFGVLAMVISVFFMWGL